jgi:hypothetical protein
MEFSFSLLLLLLLLLVVVVVVAVLHRVCIDMEDTRNSEARIQLWSWCQLDGAKAENKL